MISDKGAPKTNYLKDYRPPGFLIDTVELNFSLEDDSIYVTSRLAVRRVGDEVDLVLNSGREMPLLEILVDGVALASDCFSLEDKRLVLFKPLDSFTLTTKTRLLPRQNTSLEGIYCSNDIFCSQCEAEGFRKITWFPDRPDVMAVYTTTIEADRGRFPALLSNGNLVDHGQLPDNRHFAKWHDPFAKPCYLFALVAGDLAAKTDSFTTGSGRRVDPGSPG